MLVSDSIKQKIEIIKNLYKNNKKKEEKFIISVLFHEKIELIIEYFINIVNKFRNYNILILISCNNYINSLLIKYQLPEFIKIVTVRDNNIPIWGNVNLFDQHFKNYLYLKNNNINYNYFLFSASNDIFIRKIDDNIKKNIIIKPELNPINLSQVKEFYNKFLKEKKWIWFENMKKNNKIINILKNNNIILKVNELEGLIIEKNFIKEIMDFYQKNLYGKSLYKNYIMEEIFIASYLYSKYQYNYNTITFREKYPKNENLKNLEGNELIKELLNNYSNIYCVKFKNRNYQNYKINLINKI